LTIVQQSGRQGTENEESGFYNRIVKKWMLV